MNDRPKLDGAAIAAGVALGTVVAVMHPCRRQWAELQATEHADVRYCLDCCQSVMQVRTPQGLMRAAAARECVYVEASDSRGPFVGNVKLIDYSPSSPLNWDE